MSTKFNKSLLSWNVASTRSRTKADGVHVWRSICLSFKPRSAERWCLYSTNNLWTSESLTKVTPSDSFKSFYWNKPRKHLELNKSWVTEKNMWLNNARTVTYLQAHGNTGYTQKSDAVSKVNKKFISHLTRAQRTPSAAASVQVSHALPAFRFSCLLRVSGASFQDGVEAGKGFLCAPFWGVQICDYSAAVQLQCTV